MLLPCTIDGIACRLIACPPQGQVEAVLTLPGETVTAATQRESRRPLAALPRVERLAWTSLAAGSEAQALREALSSLTRDEGGALLALPPLLAPWWPGLSEVGTPSPWAPSGLHALATGDWSQWAVGTPGAPAALPGAVWWVPLIWGAWTRPPEVESLADDVCRLEWVIEETGPGTRALALQGVAVEAGPAWRGTARPLWPQAGSVGRPTRTGVDLEVTRRRLGSARQPVQTFFPQPPRRTVRTETPCAGDALAQMVATWLACRGQTDPIWVPAGYALSRLRLDVGPGGTLLTVDGSAAAWSTEPQLAALLPDGRVRWAPIAAVHAPDQIELAHPVSPDGATLALRAAEVSLQPLLLARCAAERINLRWQAPQEAAGAVGLVSCDWEEVAAEYLAADPADESYGVTLGPLAAAAWLYEWTDGVTTWRWTSWDVSLVRSGHTWDARTLTHGARRESLDLTDHELTVTADSWAGSPLLHRWLDRLAPPLTLRLYRTDPAAGAGAAAELLWAGEVRAVRPLGRTLEVRCAGPGGLLGRRVPAAVVQPTCWKRLFSPACGVDLAQWRITARLSHVGGAPAPAGTLIFDDLVWRGGAVVPAQPEHFMAGGWIERALGDGRRQVAAVVDSGAWLPGGALVVSHAGDFRPAPAVPPGYEPGWVLVPGCAGTWADCDRYANRARYGGLPHVPIGNPSFVKVDTSAPSGAKK